MTSFWATLTTDFKEEFPKIYNNHFDQYKVLSQGELGTAVDANR